jgi:hypothetical protein
MGNEELRIRNGRGELRVENGRREEWNVNL